MKLSWLPALFLCLITIAASADAPGDYKAYSKGYAGLAAEPLQGLDLARPHEPLLLDRDPDYQAFAYNAWDPSDSYPQGTVTFPLNSPSALSFIAPTQSSDFMAAGTMIEDTWYGLEFYTGRLWTLDTDGTMTLIGGNGTDGDGLAYDDASGILFCAMGTDLYSMDPSTGFGTLIGPIGNTAIIIALACDGEGTLYGIDMIDDQLYSIDPVSGVGTVIGPLGIDINFAQDMDYDKDGDTLYLAGFGSGIPGRFFSIDTTTGAAFPIGDFPGGMEITCLAIPYNQTLSAGWINGQVTLDGGDGNVSEVEVSAGNVSVNPSQFGFYSLEIAPGEYEVSASLEGYLPASQTSVVVTEGIITAGIDFTLISEGAGTDVYAGSISGLWPLSGSPYHIFGEVYIPNEETLVIEPGVRVEFQGHHRFHVLGRLLAQGNPEQMIKFQAPDAPGGWHGVRFPNTSAANDSSIIDYCEFRHGNAYTSDHTHTDGMGGAIAVIGFSKLRISRCLITDNHADTVQDSPGGGGIGLKASSPLISGNMIIYNTADVAGGGIFVHDGSHPVISYNVIAHNYVTWDGGGIECYHESSPEIFNNTIAYNRADEAGGGINFYTNCSPNLTNNILWGNTAVHGNQAFLYTDNVAPNFYYNDVQSGLAGIGLNYGVEFTGDYENNINENPLFTSPGYDDFHILEGSPCIDTGDPGFPDDPDGTRADMGALFFNQHPTGLDETDVASRERLLLGNYPNPFNPTTTLEFTLPTHSRVSLFIVDLGGRRVRSLVEDRILDEGQHQLTWDGKDDRERLLPSGIYFCRVLANEEIKTHRILLLK